MAAPENIQRQLRYTLNNDLLGELTLLYSPINWKDNEERWTRDLGGYNALFREYSSLDFEFPKDGKQYLENVINNQGTEAVVNITIDEMNLIRGDADAYQYQNIFTGTLDLSTYVITETILSCKAIDSSFLQTLKSRDELEIDVESLTMLDGLEVAGYKNEYISLRLPEKENIISAGINFDEQDGYQLTSTDDEWYLKPILDYSESGFEITEDTGNRYYFYENSRPVDENGFINKSKLDFNFRIRFRTYSGTSVSFKVAFGMRESGGFGKYFLTDTTYSTSSVLILGLFDGSFDFGDLSDRDSFAIRSGNKAYLAVKLFPVSGNFNDIEWEVEAAFTNQPVEVKVITDIYPQTSTKAFFLYETFNRVIQSLTGTDSPFYSSLIGREDSEPISYDSDGEYSELCLTNGKLIRGFDSNAVFTLSDLFKTINGIKPCGLGIEKTPSGNRVRLEELQYFYDYNVVLTFENATDIEVSMAEELTFSEITTGYNKAEYESKDGILEYNNKTSWSTIISTRKKELKDSQSAYRADNQGIINAGFVSTDGDASSDSQYDSSNWVINYFDNISQLLLNYNFANFTGNEPDDWDGDLFDGQKTYLGDTQVGFLAKGYMSQRTQYNFLFNEGLNIVVTYNSVSTTQVGLPTTLSIVVTADYGEGTTTYWLDSDGSWVTSSTRAGLVQTYLIHPNDLQSFKIFNIISDPLPGASMEVTVFIANVDDGFAFDGIIINEVTINRYKARTTENVSYVYNTVNNSTAMNVWLSPARILRNWGWYIRSGLEKYLNTYIKYNNSENNSSMISKMIGEDEVVESEDVLVNDLDEPIFKNVIHRFKTPMTVSQVKEFNSCTIGGVSDPYKPNYYGIVKYRKNNMADYSYIWVTDLKRKSGSDNKIAEVEGIEVDLNYVTPIE